MTSYPKWFPDETLEAKAVHYDRSTVNVPYTSLLLILISGVLAPFLLLIIVHPEIDFIVGSILYTLAFLLTFRLCYRILGRKPITLIVKEDLIVVKYLLKKKEIRPDNILEMYVSNSRNVKPELSETIVVKISSSKKLIKFSAKDFANNPILLERLTQICSQAGIVLDKNIEESNRLANIRMELNLKLSKKRTQPVSKPE